MFLWFLCDLKAKVAIAFKRLMGYQIISFVETRSANNSKRLLKKDVNVIIAEARESKSFPDCVIITGFIKKKDQLKALAAFAQMKKAARENNDTQQLLLWDVMEKGERVSL